MGVDTDEYAVERGRGTAEDRGLPAARITFENSEAAIWNGDADVVLCIGASHAWGGTVQAISALGELISPGGRMLFGEGCWEREPTPEATALFGDAVLPLRRILRAARNAGLRVLHMSTADQRVGDEFEAGWRGGRERWLLAHPEHPSAQETREEIDARLDEYVAVYRGTLGFAYLVLAR